MIDAVMSDNTIHEVAEAHGKSGTKHSCGEVNGGVACARKCDEVLLQVVIKAWTHRPGAPRVKVLY